MDWYDEEKDGLVFRGGSWSNEPVNLRISYRLRSTFDTRYSVLGFRLVQDIL